MAIYTPVRIAHYISGIIRSKVAFVDLLLGECGDWFDHQCEFFRKCEHERRVRTPRELAALDRLGNVAARLKSVRATVMSVLEEMEGIQADLAPEDWRVTPDGRMSESEMREIEGYKWMFKEDDAA